MARPALVKRGKYYHIRYTTEGIRTWKSTGCARKENAQKVFADFVLKLEQDRAGIARNKSVRLSELCEDFLEWLRSEHSKGWTRTVEGILTRLKEHLGDPLIGKIGLRDLEDFLAEEKKRGLKEVSRNKIRTALRTMFAKSVEWRWLVRSPAEDLTNKKDDCLERDWWLSKEQGDHLIECCDREDVRLFVILGLDTGARRGELLSLRWPDVDFRTGIVTFRETKTGETRQVPLTTRAKKALQEWSRVRRIDVDRVIPLGNGNFQSGLRRGFRRAVEKSELEDEKAIGKRITPHILRHSYASNLVSGGVPLLEVSRLLGHKDLKSTMRYSHLDPTNFLRAVKTLEKRTPGLKSGLNEEETGTGA